MFFQNIIRVMSPEKRYVLYNEAFPCWKKFLLSSSSFISELVSLQDIYILTSVFS